MIVRSSAEDIKEVEIGYDTVYLRDNIIFIEVDGFVGWEYNEIQMSKDDFIARLQYENEASRIEQAETSTTLLELMEVVLLGGM